MDKRDSKKYINNNTKIISIISIIILTIFTLFLKKINILPNRYFYLIVGILWFIELFFLILSFNKRTKSKLLIIIDVLFVVLVIVEGFGIYKLNQTYHFIDVGIRVDETIDYYYIVVNKDSEYEKLSDIENKVIYFYDDTDDLDKLKQSVAKKVNVIMDKVDNYSDLMEMIDTDKEKIILINEASYDSIISDLEEDDKENSNDETKKEEKYKIIDKIELIKKIQTEKTRNDITTKPFIIYLSGIDSRSDKMPSRCLSDVNMFIVVNPNTRKILMISVPRDYYVQLHGITEAKDKLTHAGMKGGVILSKATMEDLLGYDADFYVRVNFKAVIKLVDAVFPEGMTIKNNKGFTIRTGSGCTFKPGNNKVDGKCALAFARERHAYSGGDRQRGENQQQVIQLIVNKLSSTKVLLTSYEEIMEALEGTIDTNISTNNITSFIQFQLDDMRGWEFESSNLNGSDGSAKTYSFPKRYDYVMIPDQKLINKAKEKIALYLK